MTDLDLPTRMRSAVADEPGYVLDLDSVVASGRAARHRRSLVRRTAAAVGAGALAVTAVAGSPLVVRTLSPDPGAATVVVGSRGSGGSAPPTAVQGRRPTEPLDARIAAAVESTSPAGWVLDLPSGDSSPGNVDGTADDGSGPGRIYVWTSTATQLLHPCQDAEFRQGGQCQEQTLADGSVLSRRGLVAVHGVETYVVVVTHPDGSGAGAEAGNFELGERPEVISSDDKPQPVVTRSHPVYDLRQLTALVRAVDTATR